MNRGVGGSYFSFWKLRLKYYTSWFFHVECIQVLFFFEKSISMSALLG